MILCAKHVKLRRSRPEVHILIKCQILLESKLQPMLRHVYLGTDLYSAIVGGNNLLLSDNLFTNTKMCLMYACMYIGFKTFFYVVQHLDSTASYLPTGLHLRFFRSWPSLFLPFSFSSVFLVLSFVLASTSMLFWVIFLLTFFEHGRTM